MRIGVIHLEDSRDLPLRYAIEGDACLPRANPRYKSGAVREKRRGLSRYRIRLKKSPVSYQRGTGGSREAAVAGTRSIIGGENGRADSPGDLLLGILRAREEARNR